MAQIYKKALLVRQCMHQITEGFWAMVHAWGKTAHLPVQEDGLGLREVASGRRAEQHVPIVVCVFVSVGALTALAVHCPKEAEDEHDCA